MACQPTLAKGAFWCIAESMPISWISRQTLPVPLRDSFALAGHGSRRDSSCCFRPHGGCLKPGSDFHLVMAEDGEMRSDVGPLIDDFQLRKRVTVTGWTHGERMRQDLTRARARVLPSLSEVLRLVLVEAMAAGRSVLTTANAGIPELVWNGECGWLYPAGGVTRLASARSACLQTDGQALDAIRAAARAHCEVRHAVGDKARPLADLFVSAPRAALKDVVNA